jgi:hypothetical protein
LFDHLFLSLAELEKLVLDIIFLSTRQEKVLGWIMARIKSTVDGISNASSYRSLR